MIYGQPLAINFLIWDTLNSQGKIGQTDGLGIGGTGNLTMMLVKDGNTSYLTSGNIIEVNSGILPGIYGYTLSNTDTSANFITVGGYSRTSNVVVYPQFFCTERNYLPFNSGLIVTNSGTLNTNQNYITSISGIVAINSGIITTINTNINTANSNITTLDNVLDTVSGNIPTIAQIVDSGNVNNWAADSVITGYATPSDVNSGVMQLFSSGQIHWKTADTSALTTTVNAIKSATDYLPSGLIDGVTQSGVLEIVLAYCQGKISRSGDVYTYKKQDNTTTSFTLTVDSTTRTRS